MGVTIGLDFGTTTSIVSYLDGSKPKAFHYGGYAENTTPYVPSLVTYLPNDLLIGKDASGPLPDQASQYRYFKMLLPEQDRANWIDTYGPYDNEGLTPSQVTTDFIGELLHGDSPGRRRLAPIEANGDSFVRIEREKIEGVVVSVPQVWSDWRARGRQQLRGIVHDLGLRLIQLISEPVAAAAYFAYQYLQDHDDPYYGNLLICDMGGGTFDVALCKLSENKVEVLCNAGNGVRGLGIAGAHFDQALLDRKLNPRPASRVMAELLTELDRAKKDKGSYKLLRSCLQRPADATTDPIYTLNPARSAIGMSVPFTFVDIEAAFSTVREGIFQVLTRIKDQAATENHPIDKVLMVGGFSRFPLVQQAIAEAFGEDMFENRRLIDLETFSRDDMAFAISYGACLVANGKVQVAEKYDHAVSALSLNSSGPDAVEEVELIRAGMSLDSLEGTTYCSWPNGDKRLFKLRRDSVEVDIVIRSVSDTNESKIVGRCSMTDVPGYQVAGNHWYLGARVDASKIPYLVLKDEKLQMEKEYPLGDVILKHSQRNEKWGTDEFH
jgi:molecular chaperone DnaK